jgi:hypothetical protein
MSPFLQYLYLLSLLPSRVLLKMIARFLLLVSMLITMSLHHKKPQRIQSQEEPRPESPRCRRSERLRLK